MYDTFVTVLTMTVEMGYNMIFKIFKIFKIYLTSCYRRLLHKPEPRELYIYFHDSTRPNIIKLAFTLAFGVSL